MEPVKSVQKNGAKKKFPERSRRYGSDFKLQIVKKYIEGSIPISIIRQECGVGIGSVRRWVRAYRRDGEAGLSMTYTGNGRSCNVSHYSDPKISQSTDSFKIG